MTLHHTFSMLNQFITNIFSRLQNPHGKHVVLTVGNSFRRDDGLGPYIASRLSSTETIKILDAGYRPENIIDEVIQIKPKTIVILDAADFGGYAGEVRVIPEEHIPNITLSTHAIPLNFITKMIEESTKSTVFFLGIQPKSVVFGEGLSEEVKSTADEIIEAIKMITLQNNCSNKNQT